MTTEGYGPPSQLCLQPLMSAVLEILHEKRIKSSKTCLCPYSLQTSRNNWFHKSRDLGGGGGRFHHLPLLCNCSSLPVSLLPSRFPSPPILTPPKVPMSYTPHRCPVCSLSFCPCPPFPLLSKGQPEVFSGALMGAQRSAATAATASALVPAHQGTRVLPAPSPALPLSLPCKWLWGAEAGGWFRSGGRKGKKKKNTRFFIFLFYFFIIIFFFEPGSQRALRAATQCTTPTCSTAGKQASEGFNGILPEAVLLRCRLFLLPLQLTPFTVSCPPSPVPLLLSPPTMHQITRFI